MAQRRIRWAGFEVWSKPFYTLRKNRETDWAQDYPQHIVAEWMRHSIDVSANHDLKVPSELYMPASTLEVIRKRLKDVAGHTPPVESPLQTELATYYASRGRSILTDTDGPEV